MLDSYNNIAMLTGHPAIAQDVASALKVFQGELYYDTTQGIPYSDQILGKPYAPTIIKAAMEKAALTVPGVVKATASFTGLTNRVLSGSVLITDNTDISSTVTF